MEWWIEPKINAIMRLAKALIEKGETAFPGPILRQEHRVFFAGPVAVIQHYGGMIYVKYIGSDIDLIVCSSYSEKPVSYYNPQEDQYYDDVLMHLQKTLPLDALSDL